LTIKLLTVKCEFCNGKNSVLQFLPCDAMQSAIMLQYVTLRYMLTLTPTSAIWSNGNTPKLRWNRGGVMRTKACNISEMVQDRTKVTMIVTLVLSCTISEILLWQT